ncbi:MAG: acylphosphatase [Ignavibacteria bacterium]|nr:acylphosphatase [Ignavibacteria bacterium]
METVQFLISGRVQSVGFRRFALHHAHKLDLRGFATNLESGDVECVAQGSVSSLTEFEMLMRQGPQFANVTSVTCSELSNTRIYKTFRIL